MNKQEVINKLQSSLYPETSISSWDEGYNTGITQAIHTVTELDEPEKPKVPQFVADWLEVCKDNLALSLASSMNNIVMRTNNQPDKTINWVAKTQKHSQKLGFMVMKSRKRSCILLKTNKPANISAIVLSSSTIKTVLVKIKDLQLKKNVGKNSAIGAMIYTSLKKRKVKMNETLSSRWV